MKEIIGWFVIYVGIMWCLVPYIVGQLNNFNDSHIENVKDIHLAALVILCLITFALTIGYTLKWCFS